jgi:hypothetical protein
MRLSFLGRQCMRIVIASAVAIVAAADARAQSLTVTNGDFAQYTGSVAPGTTNDYFNNVAPTGWTGGGGLIFVTNDAGVNNPNLYLQVYGPFPNSPLGGNFVEADGNPLYENSFSYQLSGLTVGQTYSLSFFQAAGQQTTFTGATTNQWIVGLGTSGFSVSQIGNTAFDSYALGDANGSVAVSPLMSVASESYAPWEQVTVSLKADASNDLLTFLAWGDNGNTANLPPIAFLDIAANGAAVPEPTSLALIVLGMVGVGAYRLHQRRSKPTTV